MMASSAAATYADLDAARALIRQLADCLDAATRDHVFPPKRLLQDAWAVAGGGL